MISSNILPNILSKKTYITFKRKIAQKKNVGGEVWPPPIYKWVVLLEISERWRLAATTSFYY
jgi:hypothetical protein